MVGFVGDHVAQHLHANRPRRGPAISVKLLDTAIAASASPSISSQRSSRSRPCRTGLLRSALRAVELCWNLEMRGCSLTTWREHCAWCVKIRHNGAGVAGRFGCRISRQFRLSRQQGQMLDNDLIHAIIGWQRSGLRFGRVECEPCVDSWSRLPGSLTMMLSGASAILA